jgi:hypothetical protein
LWLTVVASASRRAGKVALSREPDDQEKPTPVEGSAGASSLTKWAAAVIVGEVSLVALFFLLGGLFKAFNLVMYAVALGVATYIGARVGGLRGPGQWLSAAIIIVLVSVALAYLLFLAAVSQIQGP